MRSVNKVVLMGHLASDPEVKSLPNGVCLTKFNLATNRDWVTGEGEKKEAADFHKIITWSKLGEVCGKFLKKGFGVYLEGRISNREYEDKAGNKKTMTEIIADTVHFLTFKKNAQGGEVNLEEMPA